MSNVLPLSSTRVSTAMTRDRITEQVQRDQNELFRLQQQLSTGLRIFLPSDDAAASQRAMSLQRTIERKEQSVTNLQGANAALVSTEAALADVSSQLAALRGEANGVIDTVATQDQRNAVINTIDRLLLDLQKIGNTAFTETRVLGGADTSAEPYGAYGKFVEYYGDESSPQTFVDLGYLFDSGTAGDDVLGGLSEAIRGYVDLQPQVTPETRLAQLNGGLGVSPNGAISLEFDPTSPSEPTVTTTIDLSSAETLEDIARLIEAGAPSGSGLVVEVQGDGLRLEASAGAIAIGEVSNGAAARELGILSPGAPVAVIDGGDVDPTLAITDRLDDLSGTKARGRIVSPGDNNDLVIVADVNGIALNNLTINYVAGGTLGAESVGYNSATNPHTLTVTIAEGQSTAAGVAAAINASNAVPFQVAPDPRDQSSTGLAGSGFVNAGAGLGVNIGGGGGSSIDLSGGLLITNGPDTYTIDTSAAETVEDLLNLLNRPEYGLAASINASGDGIDVRSRRSGADFTIGENGGTTAADLGIRTYTDVTKLADFNRGEGAIVDFSTPEETLAQNDFRIEIRDQGATTAWDIDLTAAVTVQDVRTAIDAATGGVVTAELATTGNGIVLRRNDVAVDAAGPATGTATLGADTLTITADTPGTTGNNANLELDVVDSLAGGLQVTVVDDLVTVDLGGTSPTTTAIASAISAQLTGYTVTSTTPINIGAPIAVQSFAPAGGFDADEMTVSGQVAQRLGFFADGEESVTSTTATQQSDDRHTQEVDSVFNTLLRMREALENGDSDQLGLELQRLDDDAERVNFGRAEIGVRLRTLESINNRLADEEVELRAALSNEIDADLVEVISDLTAQQQSLEASLRVSGSILSLSILDFI
ncbi:MAG: hypothetical protein AAFV43_03240 [Planctomycetota bacterium]